MERLRLSERTSNVRTLARSNAAVQSKISDFGFKFPFVQFQNLVNVTETLISPYVLLIITKLMSSVRSAKPRR